VSTDSSLHTNTGAPADAAVRAEALDATRSFIVQAPAGSGKTELLTRRVLKLLTLVDEPEEVLAITFTRKAASEMRSRVVETLLEAQSGNEPDSEYKRDGLELANAVLQRDAERDWQLLQNTQRLNLRTIDALCSTLAHQLPVVSQLGGVAGLLDDSSELYASAAEKLIDDNAQALDLLLLQLNNNHETAKKLFTSLLANRDQWSRYAVHGMSEVELRAMLEGMLERLIESRLDDLTERLSPSLTQRLTRILKQKAAVHALLFQGDKPPPGDPTQLAAIADQPSAKASDLRDWKAIANEVLTASSTLRKQVTRKEAFPVSAADADLVGLSVDTLKARKAEMTDLLELLREDEQLEVLFDEVKKLPFATYTEKDWQLLSQLLTMLPVLLAYLQIEFSERRSIDFVEMALRAKRALGEEDNPTDLALSLDLRIKHILVDEFQDTSRTQFELYKRLVAGWQYDDGRTFFAVGDPMQSIYRFREGDVTLFHQAQVKGVGAVSLEPLALTVNFRAAPAVVDWVNQSFACAFPNETDAVTGAVPYAESVAHLTTTGSVHLHPLVNVDVETEARQVAELAESALIQAGIKPTSTAQDAQDETTSVAILLRSRTQAAPVFKALRERGIPYQSIDLELLGARHVVRDLMSLCLALRFPHDRLHWLAVVRAPWCGLTLKDLHALVDGEDKTAIIDLLRNPQRQTVLTEDGRARVLKLLHVIEPAVMRSSRGALVPWVEACWLQLGGPGICKDDVDVKAAERCLVELHALEQAGNLWQASVMHKRMESLYASGDVHAHVQVMTLHKSKGLEFDTVILPSLDRKPRSNTQEILNWFESGDDADARLLLAPIAERGLDTKNAEPINALIRRANDECDAQERLRLLYVACTRAKRQLHLVARVKTKQNGDLSVAQKSSLLYPLWDRFEQHIVEHQLIPELTDENEAEPAVEAPVVAPKLQRLATDWALPSFDQYVWPDGTVREPNDAPAVEYSWAGTMARDVGTAVHELLQLLSEQNGTERQETLRDLPVRSKRLLKNLGVTDTVWKKLKVWYEKPLPTHWMMIVVSGFLTNPTKRLMQSGR